MVPGGVSTATLPKIADRNAGWSAPARLDSLTNVWRLLVSASRPLIIPRPLSTATYLFWPLALCLIFLVFFLLQALSFFSASADSAIGSWMLPCNSLYILLLYRMEGLMNNSDVYLRAMMSLIARQAFPPETLAETVSAQLNVKTLEAFNLCDGSLTQTEVAAKLHIDSGQFSRTVKRWVEDGIVIKVEQDGGNRLVHVYPVPDRIINSANKKVGKKNGERSASEEA